MTTPPYSDLHAFATVARLLNFRRAAAELGVTPSALSYAIRGLEGRLGVRLLNRTTRSVALTEPGQQLLTRLEPALDVISNALEAVNAFRATPLGNLRINAPVMAAQYVLAPLIAQFLTANPCMRLEIVADDRLVDIVDAGFDAGVRLGERVQPDMVAVPLGPVQRFVVVAAPQFLAGVTLPDCPRVLADYPCVRLRFPNGRYREWEFVQGGESFEVKVDGRFISDSMSVLAQAAADGVGFAYLLEEVVAPMLADGRLVKVYEDWCPPGSRFYLYYPSRRLPPAGLKAFVDMLRQLPPQVRLAPMAAAA